MITPLYEPVEVSEAQYNKMRSPSNQYRWKVATRTENGRYWIKLMIGSFRKEIEEALCEN